MRSRLLFGAAIALVAAAWACGGSSYNGSNPVSPTPSPGGAAGTTISIVGMLGNQSFSPNPATVAQGTTVAWKNNDSVTHRVVMNDGSIDTGNIAPGQTSAPYTMVSDGGNYHCSIHPTMIGAIKSSGGNPPPCSGVYC